MKSKWMLVLGIAALVGFVFEAAAMSPALRELEDAFIQLHEQVRPFVVNIETQGSVDMSEVDMEPYNDLFHFFNVPSPKGKQDAPQRLPRQGQGSGIVYDNAGHIVTNNHVIEDAESITVKLSNGKEYPATLVGADPDTDLAVIKIEPNEELAVAKLGDSANLRVGQFAIAVGSARGFEGSFSFGHISALGREELRLPGLRFQHFIQTDAAINLGNSGGPLCNIDGEVIGINIAIVYGANSLGFAIPINTAKEIIPVLISDGKITRGYLGVGIVDASGFADALGLPDKNGAFVKEVQPGTPAERAKIQKYDVIRSVNGEAVEGASELIRKISILPPGASAQIEVWREGQSMQIEVKLDEYAGSVKEARREKEVLGIRVQNLTPEIAEQMHIAPGTSGVIVSDVVSASPADFAGIAPGDIIIEIARKKVAGVDDFYRLVAENAVPGKSLLIGYLRGGADADITVIKVPEDFK